MYASLPLERCAVVFRPLLASFLAGCLACALTNPLIGAQVQYRFLENGNPTLRSIDAGFHADTPTREKIDLSGTWSYQIEGGPSGTVRVPSAYDFIGTVEFTRKFEISSHQVEDFDFQLVMLGSNHNTEVSINGEFVTNHAGGYTSFVVPLHRTLIQPGTENIIRVVTNNRLDSRKTIPLRSFVWEWRNYGGILRDIYLLATPRLRIQSLLIDSELGVNYSTARLIVRGMIEGDGLYDGEDHPDGKKPGHGFSVEVFDKITGLSVAKSAPVSISSNGKEWTSPRCEILLQTPKTWSPESPELYVIKASIVSMQSKEKEPVVIDEYQMNYGFRDLVIRAGNFQLNGKPLVLKGVLWMEDHPTWGSALPHEEMEKDVALVKSLGANAIRFRGHPPHPYMLNLCDRYGLLVLEEIPLVDVPAMVLSQEEFIESASTMMREMITRDRHHPSVIAWGIGDQFESGSSAGCAAVESLVKVAKSIDTRPTYFASRMLKNDPCIDLVDIAAVNITTQDIKTFKAQLQSWSTQNSGKPVVVARFGSEVEHGNRNGYSDPLSYEAQARYYIQRFDIIRTLEYDGAFVWSFNDWKGDRPALTVNSGDPWLHTMGLVSGNREKRLAYEAVRSIFRGEKFVALPIGNHSSSAPIIYVLSGLVVLIGAAYFYNASRRFREALNRSVMNSYNFFADVRDQRIVSPVHSTLLGMIVSIATAIVVSSMLYHFRDSWALDNALSVLLVFDDIKETVVHLIWNPLLFITYFSIFFFLMLLLIAAILMIISPLFKAKIYPFHAYSITMWSTPPLLILVPMGMILYRVMESSMYVVPAIVVVGLLLFWVLMRLLKGISIIFDAATIRVYLLGFISVAGVFACVYLYYDYTQSTSTYLSYIYTVVTNSQ